MSLDPSGPMSKDPQTAARDSDLDPCAISRMDVAEDETLMPADGLSASQHDVSGRLKPRATRCLAFDAFAA